MKRVAGFTIVEVLVAAVVLGVGVIALAGTSGLVTRMVGDGRRSTRMVQALEARLELIRSQALAPGGCGALASGTAALPGGATETWDISGAGATRGVRAAVAFRTAHGPAGDTLTTIVACR
ncbi:MAG: prepilin-type N-terminal cleavage/methylation domain-containing protein [Gemmatimonadales bacterium]|nr:prepilin-type N-terminal cleavage/methylation domain-containing protein [Gemmatimonadales bacterium]